MFKVNDYLEIKDLHVPTAYLDEFCQAFEVLLENHAAQLVDVSVLSNFNSEPVASLDETTPGARGHRFQNDGRTHDSWCGG